LTDFDRIVGLRDRTRMGEALALYRDLRQRHIDIPAYALAAVADAYLHQRQPERARNLYLEALALSRNDREYPNREWQLGLVNAYIDANEFDAAQALIDQLEQEIPPVLNRGSRGVEVDNEFYEEARVEAARARIYADRLDAGQALLDPILAAAPFNLDARLAYADLLSSREQPRAAQARYASVLTDDPANRSAAAGIAETALELHDLNTAETQIHRLFQNYPENREVRRVRQRLLDYRRPVLSVESGFGQSSTGGGNKGNRDWQVDALLHSAPFHEHWRVFAHTFNAEADFEEETGVRRRIGVGVDYRAPSWDVSGELNQDQTGLDNVGLSLRAAWLPSDHWRLEAGFDADSNDIPLRASAAGIDKRTFLLGAGYIQDESRGLSTNVAYSWFSDSNRRVEAGAEWFERWWSGPVYKLDTRLSVYGSDNTLEGAAYFNPGNDFSVDLQLSNEWTLWRRYQRSFKHRLGFGAGQYRQQGFGTKTTTSVRYEQEWDLDNFRALNYGVTYDRHPFDGEIDARVAVFLNLAWRF
jgi:biofilm PGA synthesis protein PgaA